MSTPISTPPSVQVHPAREQKDQQIAQLLAVIGNQQRTITLLNKEVDVLSKRISELASELHFVRCELCYYAAQLPQDELN